MGYDSALKEVIKNIILGLVVILISAYLIGAAIWFSTQPKQTICSAIEWVIDDSWERQYVTSEELTNMINHTNLNPAGKAVDDILTQAIEACVMLHPMVRKAQCFVTTQGRVIVRLTQRVPLLGVRTESSSYYIDTDRLHMPASGRITTPVIWAVGKTDDHLAKTVLADMVEWLQCHSYWENRIERIEVRNDRNIVLVDSSSTRIIVGDGQEFESKMFKLRLFEEQMEKVGNGNTYKELDLRYKDQVIGKE